MGILGRGGFPIYEGHTGDPGGQPAVTSPPTLCLEAGTGVDLERAAPLH